MAGIYRVPDGMPSVVIWSMRQSRKTRSITAGPISFGTAAKVDGHPRPARASRLH